METCNDSRQRSKPSFFYQYCATFSGSLIIVSVGMHYGWSSPSLPLLLSQNSTIPISDAGGSWVVIMPLIGLPVGCIIAAVLADRIGRKTCTLMGAPLIFVSWIIIAYASTLSLLQSGRFLAGIGEGLVYTPVPMYIGEIADKNIRGFLSSTVQVAFMVGMLAINVIGLHFDIKATALIASILPLLHFATFAWMPESPYFYVMRNDNRKAAASLRKLTKMHNTDEEISTLIASTAANSKTIGKLTDLFRNAIDRKALGIVLGLWVVEQCTGWSAITFYCLSIFNEAGGSVKGSTATMIYFGVQLLVSAVSGVLVDKTGRKVLLVVSTASAGCALAAKGVYFYLKNATSVDMSNLGFLPLAALLLYTASYGVGLANIPMVMTGELFPTNSKAFAICFTNVSFSVLSAAVSKFFQITKDEYGSHVPFFAYAVSCVFGLVFIKYCVPETKGKTLEQIQIDWKNSQTKNKSGNSKNVNEEDNLMNYKL